MGYLISALALAAVLAVAKVATEFSSEYFAQYMVENESQDLGASTDSRPGEAVIAPTAPGARVEAAIGTVQPVLFTGAALLAAAEGVALGAAPAAGKPSAVADAAIIPAVATVAATTETDWLDAYRRGKASTDEPAGLENDAAQARLGVSTDTPYRRPDGTVFMPIASQRLFLVRSTVTRIEDLPLSWEIPGRVTTNAATGTMVHAPRAGIVEAVDGVFPYLGMKVRRGDLLGYLRPTFGASERAQIDARIEQLIALISLSGNQIARLEEVFFVRYRANKIEALKVEMEGHRRELSTLQSAIADRQMLRATADGVISAVNAVANATVDQGQPVFQIVDPNELWVEASAFDPTIANNIHDAAALTADGRAMMLTFVGGGLAMNNQAIPLRFRVLEGGDGLNVGAPVTVIVRGTETLRAIAVPASSVLRDSDGRTMVWERVSAETFLPRYVQSRRLAGDMVAVSAGLSSGLRIVTSGANILAQVR